MVAQAIQDNPFDKTILISVTVRMLGVSRKVNTDRVEVESDKSLLRVSKKILECDEFGAIQFSASALKSYLRSKMIPGVKFIKGGIYPVPAARVEEIDARINECIQDFNLKVARFLEVYEARAEECRERLKVLGEMADYPPVAEVKLAFGITTEYITLGPPKSLQSISKDIWDREASKIQSQCQAAAGQVQDAMRQMFADLVNHMVDRLTPDKDGKKKIFRDSVIGNFKDFIDGFADRNITGDDALAEMVGKAQAILAGKSVDSFRKDDALRSLVADRMTEVKASLDTMIENAPSRRIMLADEPDDIVETSDVADIPEVASSNI